MKYYFPIQKELAFLFYGLLLGLNNSYGVLVTIKELLLGLNLYFLVLNLYIFKSLLLILKRFLGVVLLYCRVFIENTFLLQLDNFISAGQILSGAGRLDPSWKSVCAAGCCCVVSLWAQNASWISLLGIMKGGMHAPLR